MNLTIKAFEIPINASLRFIARGYSDAGQLIVESTRHDSMLASVDEIAEWCYRNRPAWGIKTC